MIVVSNLVGVELSVRAERDCVDGFGDFDVNALARLDVNDAKDGRRVAALRDDVEVFEEVNRVEHDAGAVRDDLLPVLLARVGDGRGDEAEVASASLVRADVEAVAVVLCVVLVPGFARLDEL